MGPNRLHRNKNEWSRYTKIEVKGVFNLFRELETLAGFILGESNLNIRYADEIGDGI